jgi:hypothetical protein
VSPYSWVYVALPTCYSMNGVSLLFGIRGAAYVLLCERASVLFGISGAAYVLLCERASVLLGVRDAAYVLLCECCLRAPGCTWRCLRAAV